LTLLRGASAPPSLPGQRNRGRFRIVGTDRPAEWRTENGAVVVDIPGSFVPGDATVVKFAWEGPAEEPASGFYTDII